jgi:hypothetical protein
MGVALALFLLSREAFRAARDGRKFFLIDGKGTDPASWSAPWPAT